MHIDRKGLIANFSRGRDVDLKFNNRWQDFEDHILKIVLSFGVDADFRKVFFNDKRKFEIDVVGYWNCFCLCIDCKLYRSGRYRVSSLKKEAAKHVLRCIEFEKIIGKACVPVLVTLLDDDICFESECLIVPHYKFNYFLNDIHRFIHI